MKTNEENTSADVSSSDFFFFGNCQTLFSVNFYEKKKAKKNQFSPRFYIVYFNYFKNSGILIVVVSNKSFNVYGCFQFYFYHFVV